MKRYIKTNKSDMKEIIKYRFDITLYLALDIDLDFLFQNVDIAASVDGFDYSQLTDEVLAMPVSKFEDFVDTVHILIQSRGLHEVMDKHDSPKSCSEYYTFCLETDFAKLEAEVFFYLRITNHPLIERFKHTTAKQAQRDWAKKYLPPKLNKYNTLAEESKILYELAKEAASMLNESFVYSPPMDVMVEVDSVDINGLPSRTVRDALIAIDLKLADIVDDLYALSKVRAEQRKKWQAGFDDVYNDILTKSVDRMKRNKEQ